LVHRLVKECSGRLGVAFLGDERFNDFTLVINGTPQVVCLAVDANEDLVEVPTPLW
jgi:hypothetical protein